MKNTLKTFRYWFIVFIVLFNGLYLMGVADANADTGNNLNIISHIANIVLVPVGTWIAYRFLKENNRWIGGAIVFAEFVVLQRLGIYLSNWAADLVWDGSEPDFWLIIVTSATLIAMWGTSIYSIVIACLPRRKHYWERPNYQTEAKQAEPRTEVK